MFAFVKTPYWERVDEDTKEGFAELIEQLGEQVEEIELLPSAIDAWQLHRTIMEAEMAANLEREWDKGRDRLSEQLRAQLERGRNVRAIDYQRALSRIAPIHESFVELFEQRYDAILTPAAPGTAPSGSCLDRGSGLLHFVDAVWNACDKLASPARCERPAARRSARRPTRRRRASAAHRALAGGPGRGQLRPKWVW